MKKTPPGWEMDSNVANVRDGQFLSLPEESFLHLRAGEFNER